MSKNEPHGEITIKCLTEADATVLNLIIQLVDEGRIGFDGFASYEKKGKDFSFKVRRNGKICMDQ